MAFLWRVLHPGDAVAFPISFLRDTLLKRETRDILLGLDSLDKRLAMARLNPLVTAHKEPALLAFRGYLYKELGCRDSCIGDCEMVIKMALPREAAVRLYAHMYEGVALAESADSRGVVDDSTQHARLYRQAVEEYNAALMDDLADVFTSMNIRYMRERVREPRGDPTRALAMASPPWEAWVIFSAGVIMGLAVMILELDGWLNKGRAGGSGRRKPRGPS
jgi:hypothetical protein